MNRLRCFCFAIPFLLLSCKNETPVEKLKLVEHKILDSEVYLELEMLVEEDDVFSVFYTEDGSFNYSAKKMLKRKIKGNSQPQIILFKFPEAAKPTAIRIDIGVNPNQQKIMFKRYAFNYFDEQLIINDAFLKYYRTNPFFRFNSKKKVFIPTKAKQKYDPILFCKPALVKQLKQLISEKNSVEKMK